MIGNVHRGEVGLSSVKIKRKKLKKNLTIKRNGSKKLIRKEKLKCQIIITLTLTLIQ